MGVESAPGSGAYSDLLRMRNILARRSNRNNRSSFSRERFGDWYIIPTMSKGSTETCRQSTAQLDCSCGPLLLHQCRNAIMTQVACLCESECVCRHAQSMEMNTLLMYHQGVSSHCPSMFRTIRSTAARCNFVPSHPTAAPMREF